jgi:uncharacterized protein with PIN domain
MSTRATLRTIREKADPRVWSGRLIEAEQRSERAIRQVARLRERVADLEVEIMECRNVNKRLAEVIDVFVEVVVPAEHRDAERLTSLLSAYEDTRRPWISPEPPD